MDYAFLITAVDRCVEWRERHDELVALAHGAGSDWLLVRGDGHAAVTADGRLALVPGDRLRHAQDDWVFLGMRRSRPLFVLASASAAGEDGTRWMDLRSAAASLDAGEAGILAYARALTAWRERHRYCGRCGHRNRIEAGGHRLRCPACDGVTFPRTDPAIIVAVRDGERCLLGRQPGWSPGRYSTLAGFVEPGETLEAAVAREVHEEAGVRVGDCRYAGSQPWPFPASLMLGFEARASTSELRLGDELEDARWFHPDELVRALATGECRLPATLSISHWLIDRWFRDVTGQALPASQDGY